MFRNRERFITAATAVTLLCFAVTMWASTKVSFSAARQFLTSEKQIDVNTDARRVINDISAEHPSRKAQERTDKPVIDEDVWNNDGAIEYLSKYNRFLNQNKKPIKADPSNDSTITEWWQAVAMFAWYMHSPLRYNCKQNLTWFGGWGVCQDEPYTVKTPCLVYSFGIAYDFVFDDEVSKIGCDVRSFDPSMSNVSDHQRSSNVMFYTYGLYDRNTNSFKPDLDIYVKDYQIWKMRTLKSIMLELGHNGRTLDILKIDIESTEWPVFDNMMETDMFKYIRHLLVEYHYFPTRPHKNDYVHYFQVHTKLRKMGFREYYKRPHSEFLIPDNYRHQGETFYINSNFQMQ